MAFEKITENVENISLLADTPAMTPTELKAEFDKGNKTIKTKFNKLVDDLNELDLPEVCETVEKSTEYSTEEKKVGTWVDGKPIYRKVYKGTLSEVNTSLLIPINVEDWDEVITLKGMLKIPSKNLRISIPGVVYNQNTLQGLQLQIIDRNSGWQPNKFYIVTPNNEFTDYMVIFEYTKTTD